MTETIKTTNVGNHKQMLDDVDDGNHKKKGPDGFRDELSICVYIYI